MQNKTVAIIPARGGSKGIPRKNLRPLAGKPLIYYSISACLNAENIDRVIVSTDDDEIAIISERLGATVIMRAGELSEDHVTLDPVIQNVVQRLNETYNEQYDIVVTVQPTSPLVLSSDIDQVVSHFCLTGADTVMSVVDDRHLSWERVNDQFVPAYNERVNRQQLPVRFKETGAVVACSTAQLDTGSRVGNNIQLYEIPHERSFDIDTFADLYLCESLLNRKRIVFTVIGYAQVGLGHAFRTVMLANELVGYELIFLVEERSDLAIDYISSHNYLVQVCKNGDFLPEIEKLQPDLVINDILDTTELYMSTLSSLCNKIVNFEDLSSANQYANFVINALYPQCIPSDKVFSGPQYFCVRDEFLYLPCKDLTEDVSSVLITFGGVDEGNLTERVLSCIEPIAKSHNIRIVVITGPGYQYQDSLCLYEGMEHIDIIKYTKKISEYMRQADVAITSGGRTVLELSGIGVPTMVICQNERETTHMFASSENGIINLGDRKKLSDTLLQDTFLQLVGSFELRRNMLNRMEKLDIKKGKQRVVNKIINLLKGS